MIVRQLLVWVGAALALASPLLGGTLRGAGAGAPRSLDLHLVKDRAICPIEVVVDHDPLRIPARIQLLKCARRPLARCLAGRVPRAHCCDWREQQLVAECVEIVDYVAVQYRTPAGARTALEPYAVPVGCTCLATPATDALED